MSLPTICPLCKVVLTPHILTTHSAAEFIVDRMTCQACNKTWYEKDGVLLMTSGHRISNTPRRMDIDKRGEFVTEYPSGKDQHSTEPKQ
jgi:hypothetical protein